MNIRFLLLGLAILMAYSPFAQTTFTNAAPSAGVQHFPYNNGMGGGVALFDFNNDSLVDILYTGGKNKMAALYQNLGNGNFIDVAISAGLGFTDSLSAVGVTTGDIDNDGYRDIFLYASPGHTNHLLKNNGDGTFTDISASAGVLGDSLWTMSATFGDYDKDGYLDLYVGRYILHPNPVMDSLGNFIAYQHVCLSNRLFHNNGDNTFTDLTQTTTTSDTGCNLATAFTDYDGDGDVDIMNANDFGAWISTSILYQNNYPNPFSDVSTAANMADQIYGMGIAIGDYDQDMDLDYYITNIGRNILHRNMGNGTFIDSSDAAGVGNEWIFPDSLHATGWGTAFVDIDNDSYLDLYVANGHIDAFPEIKTSVIDPDQLFHNNGDGTFTNISALLGADSLATTRGFGYADYDNDGDIDLFPITTLTIASNDTIYNPILRNDLNNSNNWLKVNLEGTISNRDAYGSHIKIYINGKSWVHEVGGQGSHCSQHSSIAHFGLGNASIVDSLVVHWTNGLVESFSNISVNQSLHIIEGLTLNNSPIPSKKLDFLAYPNPATNAIFVRCYNNNLNHATLSLSNALGQQVWTQKINSNSPTEINTTQLASGIYFVHLSTGKTTQTQKIVIKK